MLWPMFFLGVLIGATLGILGVCIIASSKGPRSSRGSSSVSPPLPLRGTGSCNSLVKNQVKVDGDWWDLYETGREVVVISLGDGLQIAPKTSVAGWRMA